MMPVKPSIFALHRSRTDSQKPMTYLVTFYKEMQDINDITLYYDPYMMTDMEIAMELARVNIRPMAPPNSGPRDLGL